MSSHNQLERMPLRRGIQESLVSALSLEDLSADVLNARLRALQRTGMPDVEIRIFLERERALREDREPDGVFEANVVDALDVITGLRGGLELNDAARCAAELARFTSPETLRRAMDHAFEASDLLPVNRAYDFPQDGLTEVADRLSAQVDSDDYRPQMAHFTRAPKRRFVSRPAASLRLPDRVIYQALADVTNEALAPRLPVSVLWPRPGVTSMHANQRYGSIQAEWKCSYVVHADVESFFEYIDHTLLAHIMTAFLGLPQGFGSALESFLNVTMDSTRGLPQGPEASNTFATAYLLPLDVALEDAGWRFARYQDDIKVAAADIVDAKQSMRQLEASLRDFGLRLAPEKSFYVSARKISARAFYSTDNAQDRAAEARRSNPAETDRLVGEFEEVVEKVFSEKGAQIRQRAEARLRFILTQLASGSGSTGVSYKELTATLDLFPQLAPEAAQYLATRFGDDRSGVIDFIRSRLSGRREMDWENAWIVLAPDLGDALLQAEEVGLYKSAAGDRELPPLTRCNVIKVLVRRRPKGVTLEQELLEGIPDALLSELALDVGLSAGGAHGFRALTL